MTFTIALEMARDAFTVILLKKQLNNKVVSL